MSIMFDKTQSVLETIAEESSAIIGVHAFDPADPDIEFAVNADRLFPTASIIKVPILLEFYNQVAAGDLDPDEVRRLSNMVKVGGSGVLQFMSEETRITLEDWGEADDQSQRQHGDQLHDRCGWYGERE